jgi:hypothetical protein
MVYDLKDMHGGEGVGEVAANIQWDLGKWNWVTGTSKNYEFIWLFLNPCIRKKFLWNVILCVNGPASLGGDTCNQVTWLMTILNEYSILQIFGYLYIR